MGVEAVYVPLEVDPNLSRWSNFLAVPLANRPDLAYACMTVHVLYLLRLRDTMELFHYLMDGMNPHRFDNRVLNLSVDALRDGRITYIPNGEITAVTLPAYASSQIRVLYCFVHHLSLPQESAIGFESTPKRISPKRISPYKRYAILRTNSAETKPQFRTKPKSKHFIFRLASAHNPKSRVK